MFIKSNYISAILLIASVLFFDCTPHREKREVQVAAAANVQFPMKEIGAAFEKETGITVRTVFGSSGKLTAQIENGAPFDLFLSADMAYPESLHASGFTTAAPRIYAYGTIVFWSMEDGIDPAHWKEAVRSPSVAKIALANPKNAPYGVQTIRALKYFHLYDNLEEKLVMGESISQVNQFIVSRAAGCGFTAKSVVLSPEMTGKGKWIDLPAESYEPIEQGVVILSKGEKENKEYSNKFYEFLFSATAKKIFRKYGYKTP